MAELFDDAKGGWLRHGFLVALLAGLLGGVVNVLIDIPALWNYDWSLGFPTYEALVHSPHRYLNTPAFCLVVSVTFFVCSLPLVVGRPLGTGLFLTLLKEPVVVGQEPLPVSEGGPATTPVRNTKPMIQPSTQTRDK